MASFQNMVITTAGLELLQDLILEGGTPLTFSGVGVGDGLLEDSDITDQTSLVHEVHRLPIEKIEKQEGGHIRVFARLATDIITTDFYHRELGVFARHGEQEILFAYGNAGDDYDFIPATGNNASICKTIVTEFTVGSMKAVFLPLDSSDLVTHSSLNERIEQIKSGDNAWEGNQTINGALVVNNPDGSSSAGTLNQIYGIVRFWQSVDLRDGGWLRGTYMFESGILNISQRASFSCIGPASFSSGVTMAQTLSVEGTTVLKGGLGVGETITFYDSVGVQAAEIAGVYISPDESGLDFGNSSGTAFLRLKYNTLSKYVDVQLPTPGSSLHLPLLAPIDIDGSCSARAFNFGPNSVSFDPANPTRVTTSGAWNFGGATFTGGVTMAQSLNVTGRATVDGGIATRINDAGNNYWDICSTPAKSKVMTLRCSDNNSWIDVEARNSGLWLTDQAGFCGSICLFDSSGHTVLSNLTVRNTASFSSGVTMAQSLNVAGVATMFRCAVYDESYSLFAVLTGSAVWQNRASGVFELRGDDSYSMGVSLSIGRSNGEAGRIIKQPQKEPLNHTDVPNCGEGDTRWLKYNNSLTDAQYAALGVKDQTTLYVTDTGKVYIGIYALN